MSAGTPDLSIIVLSWNTKDLLEACLESLVSRDHGLMLEIIVVDNASEDGSADLVAEQFPQVVLQRNARNDGYAGGNNQGIQRARAPFLLLLNSDTEVRGEALSQLVGFLKEHPEYGAVAPRLVHESGEVQKSCMRFPGLKVAFLYDSWLDRALGKTQTIRRYFMEDFDHLHSRDVDQPPGACFLLRREVVERVGVFDEELFLFFNDVDFCRRIVAGGWKIHYLAEAEVLHHVGGSTSKFRDFVREWNVNRVRYYRKHYGIRGTMVVKVAVLLRGLEEMGKVLGRAPAGERMPGIRDIWRVMGATFRA